MSKVEVFDFTPAELNRLFTIPIYQRLYAWEEQEIRQLLRDLLRAFQQNNQKNYFIGNIVLAKSLTDTSRYDLIDGQQRITTLWLLGFVFAQHITDDSGVPTSWRKFLKSEEGLRIHFAAREGDRRYLEALYDSTKEQTQCVIANEHANLRMVNAIHCMEQFIKDKEVEDIQKFSEFVLFKTCVIATVLPEKTDLTKYFEVMNNRGKQLEKHEILKARIFSHLSGKQQKQASEIWDDCANMHAYLPKKYYNKTENITIDGETSKNEISSNSSVPSLLDVLKQSSKECQDGDPRENQPKDKGKYRSIIQFPEFLLHVYKIWMFKKDSNENNWQSLSLVDKHLLDVVKIHSQVEAVCFVNTLLEIRILFDDFIFKYNQTNSLEVRAEIRNYRTIPEKEDKESRRNVWESMTVLQTMLYVSSTENSHWLTPFLLYLRKQNLANIGGEWTEIEEASAIIWLETLDNALACNRITTNNLIDVANKAMNDSELLTDMNDLYDYLNKVTYTGERRLYWFYKLDYCLWKKWSQANAEDLPNNSTLSRGDLHSYIKKFQFRFNRSIEHIRPQNPEIEFEQNDNDGEWLKESNLHHFKNLALISSSSNSSNSNHSFVDKKNQFKYRTERYKSIESLKFLHAMSFEKWSVADADSHSNEMFKVWNEYHIAKNL